MLKALLPTHNLGAVRGRADKGPLSSLPSSSEPDDAAAVREHHDRPIIIQLATEIA